MEEEKEGEALLSEALTVLKGKVLACAKRVLVESMSKKRKVGCADRYVSGVGLGECVKRKVRVERKARLGVIWNSNFFFGPRVSLCDDAPRTQPRGAMPRKTAPKFHHLVRGSTPFPRFALLFESVEKL